MSISSSDPTAPAHILPVGDRQLERIQPDHSLVVRVQPVDGGPAVESAVVDLSLHGLLLQSIPSLDQGALVDLIDLEPQPIRASVVRQSDLGTHVSFVDHLHPRYTRAKKGAPNRRRHARVPCESPASIGPAVATVLNASLGGVMVRVTAPRDWGVGDRVVVTIDAHKRPLTGQVVAVTEDRLSVRFDRAQPLLRITAADCVITVEQRQMKATRMKAATLAKKRPAAKAAQSAKTAKAARKAPVRKAAKRKAARKMAKAKRPAARARAKPKAKKRR